ncbi:hypothetical protein EHQ94_10935 [Leptospira meyeri]|uniref:hypothetical protein n=1 Tax=Leptospira meyeri TaxID=29508 RepID=UPI00108332D3|nr:hypothetical protein [Leptospira meyeri]TGM60602.1 hypothetical protein EHQ93_17930 [Leptospira meyeri]TGM66489.1 hypothetical protein EHQ94_10935 [Leptospira meyeri]
MKKIIITILLFGSTLCDLNAIELENKSAFPINLQIFYRRNSSSMNTFEEELYTKTFTGYVERNKREPISSFDIGIRKKINDTNIFIEAEFSELKKGAYPIGRFFCSREGSFCNETSTPAGTYYRSQTRAALLYEIIPNSLRLSGGIRYLYSELADGFRFQYSLKFGQKYLGPEIGIEAESPKFWNFNLKFNYYYFILGGHIQYHYATSSNNAEYGFLSFLSEPVTRYYGQQLGLKLNYFITDNYYFSLGFYSIIAKIRTNSINIYSEDVPYDNFINTKFRTLYGNSFGERINNIYFEAGIFI